MSKIETFEDIVKVHKISSETVEVIRTRLANSMGMEKKDVAFTALQREAFKREGFWLSDFDTASHPQHIIIQGATSSGKTLVSEMALLDTLKEHNKVIVIVPLRAMVRERWEHLKKDLEPQGNESIYASSSDFMDHDSEIINGDYKVAVIVYEKFFAMITNSSSKLLENCGLLIVDEIQMLNHGDRGPKLETALQKVLRKNDKNPKLITRIMCLTTCDCKIDYLTKWLTTDKIAPISISNKSRPTSLEEYVIQHDGTYRMRKVPGEKDSGEVGEPIDGKIEVTNYNPKLKTGEKKKSLLLEILKKVYAEKPNAKVLVFVNGRDKTRRLAEFVADEKLFEETSLEGDLLDIQNYDDDEYQKILKNKLLPVRVAFHNAAMSTALREFVEDVFQKDSLRLVIATETLTVGMNMPVDVMIMYDCEIQRGAGSESLSLTAQEYRNYIGRAGRLGQKDMLGGKSYLIVQDSSDLGKRWHNYVEERPTEIKSALLNKDEEFQAPYYLSLMSDSPEGYTKEDLIKLWNESFAKNSNGKEINVQIMLDKLVKAELCSTEEEEDEEEYKTYVATIFGNTMAPYTFTLKTCKEIYKYFLRLGKDKKGGLPKDIKPQDVEKYLPDILYIICGMSEVEKNGQVTIHDETAATKVIKNALEKFQETFWKDTFWKGSLLEKIITDETWFMTSDKRKKLVRTIILWCWSKGFSLEEIRNQTGFNKFMPLIAGDIARLSETVAYILEAFKNCLKAGLSTSDYLSKLVVAFYRLSTCVNYGVSRELVQIANKHVHALDRKAILKLGKFYETDGSRYEDIFHMLRNPEPQDLIEIEKIIHSDQLEELRKNFTEANTHERFSELLEGIRQNAPDNFGEDECTALEELAAPEKDGTENLLQPLTKIFISEEDSGEYFFGENVKLKFLTKNKNCAEISFGAESFIVIAYHENFAETLEDFNFYVGKIDKPKIILLVSSDADFETENGKVSLKDSEENFLEPLPELAMKFETFAGLIAQSVLDGNISASKLAAFLEDTVGVFKKPIRFFNQILQNYELMNSTAAENSNVVNVIWDKSQYKSAVEDLRKILENRKIAYRELAWGKYLGENSGLAGKEPVILMLNRDSVESSKSLSDFCEKLRRANFRNTFAFFNNEDAFKNFSGDAKHPYEYLEHSETTRNFEKDIVRATRIFTDCQDAPYFIGISYAHDDRAGHVKLLEKFVEKLHLEFPDKKIFFDQNNSSEFNGNGAQGTVLDEYYAQCEYFFILDNQNYDNSEFCLKEGRKILDVVKNRNETQIVWFLNPKNAKHCKYWKEFEKELHGYTTQISEESIDRIFRDFSEVVREHHQE